MKDNIRRVIEGATEWELQWGHSYYDRQRGRLFAIARQSGLIPSHVVGAFAALSPNNSEKNTYIALDAAIRTLKSGRLAPRFCGFPANREKALLILGGSRPEDVLSGPKITAFYHNTMDPDDETYITIDGHMLNMCRAEVKPLTKTRKFSSALYATAADAIRGVAAEYEMKGPRFQAILWITWKRMHRILWSPQLTFDWYW